MKIVYDLDYCPNVPLSLALLENISKLAKKINHSCVACHSFSQKLPQWWLGFDQLPLLWVFFQDGIIWEFYSLKNLLIQIELRLGFSFFWGGFVHVFHAVSSCGVSKYLSTMYSIYLMSYDRICFHLAVDHFCCSFSWLFSAGIKFMLKGLHGLWAWSIFYHVVLFPW